jgi:HTH-type transcriptional regulator/antitoxin HigA
MKYLELISRFPLRPLEKDTDHASAVEVAIELTRNGDAGMNKDELDYLSVLAMLIEKYELATLESKKNVSPAEVLRFLMEENGLKPADIAAAIGKTHLSAVFAGARKISKTEAAKLGAYFSVDPQLFLDNVLPFRKTEPAKSAPPRRGAMPQPEANSDLPWRRRPARKSASRKMVPGVTSRSKGAKRSSNKPKGR